MRPETWNLIRFMNIYYKYVVVEISYLYLLFVLF
jgi:hypothetical protein